MCRNRKKQKYNDMKKNQPKKKTKQRKKANLDQKSKNPKKKHKSKEAKKTLKAKFFSDAMLSFLFFLVERILKMSMVKIYSKLV